MNIVFIALVSVFTGPTIVNGADAKCETLVILGQDVKVIDFDSQGVPLSFAYQGYIGVNKEFSALPEYVQETLVAHELGHIYLGHLKTNDKIGRDQYPYLWNTVSPRERDADLFAAELLGDETVMKALKYVEIECQKIMAISCVVEARIRYNIIKDNSCQ